MAEALADCDGTGVAVLMGAPLSRSDLDERMRILRASAPGYPLAEDSSRWTPEFRAIVSGELRVTRFAGRFPRSKLEWDLDLKPGLQNGYDRAIYRGERVVDGHPDAEDSSGPSGANAAAGVALALLLAAVVGPVVRVRRSRRHATRRS